MTTPETWELYAVKYATLAERRRSGNLLGIDPHDDAPMPIDYYVWAAISPTRTIVIDTGFDAAEAARRGRTLVRPVAEGLAMIGVSAPEVEDVIVTHLHFDHIGGFEAFPAARFHLQEREMQYATGPYMCHPHIRHSFTADHVAGMVHRLFEGRVAFVDGQAEIAPGLSVHFIGGHTMGLQCVRALTRRGWVVLAADAAHFYENLERGLPFPIVFNIGDMLRGHDTLRALAETPAHVVPGHDPLVLARYPVPDRRLEGVVARLDAEPR